MAFVKEKPNPQEEEKEFSEIIGDLVEQWGFKRHLGRIWSLLYLRRKPMNPSQIQKELSLSAGNVNALLNELQTWGVVHRVRIANDRNFYYEAEPHIWKSMSNVAKARELRILEEAILEIKKLEESLKKKGKDPKAQYQSKQIQHVYETLDSAFALARLIVHASPEKLSKMSRVVSRLRSL